MKFSCFPGRRNFVPPLVTFYFVQYTAGSCTLKDQVIHRDNRVGNILNNVVVVVVVVVHVYFPRDGPEEKNKKREFVTRRFDECEMEFKQKNK